MKGKVVLPTLEDILETMNARGIDPTSKDNIDAFRKFTSVLWEIIDKQSRASLEIISKQVVDDQMMERLLLAVHFNQEKVLSKIMESIYVEYANILIGNCKDCSSKFCPRSSKYKDKLTKKEPRRIPIG